MISSAVKAICLGLFGFICFAVGQDSAPDGIVQLRDNGTLANVDLFNVKVRGDSIRDARVENLVVHFDLPMIERLRRLVGGEPSCAILNGKVFHFCSDLPEQRQAAR